MNPFLPELGSSSSSCHVPIVPFVSQTPMGSCGRKGKFNKQKKQDIWRVSISILTQGRYSIKAGNEMVEISDYNCRLIFLMFHCVWKLFSAAYLFSRSHFSQARRGVGGPIMKNLVPLVSVTDHEGSEKAMDSRCSSKSASITTLTPTIKLKR